MGSHSQTYKATAAPSVGTGWYSAAKIYDNDINSKAYRENLNKTSAVHINGFGISLPNNATVNSIEVHTRLSTSNNYGYAYIYVYTDANTSGKVVATQVADGVKMSAQYVVQTYSASQLITGINNLGVHNGNLVEFLKNLRVRFVMGATGSSNICSCNIYDNYVVVNYTIPDYTINATAMPTEGGTVAGGGTYEAGQTVTLSAKPNTGYKFKQWSDDGNTSVNRTVTVSGNATYTAQFERLKYNITATVSPANSGTVSGAGVYSHGDTATLTATAATGFQFVRWSDGETSPTRTQTVTDVASFTAIFEKAATSNTFRGTSRQTVYGGTKQISAYKGTTKIS